MTRIGFEDTTQIRKDWLFNARRVRQWMKSSKRCSLLCIALVLTRGWPNKRSQGTADRGPIYIYIYICTNHSNQHICFGIHISFEEKTKGGREVLLEGGGP